MRNPLIALLWLAGQFAGAADLAAVSRLPELTRASAWTVQAATPGQLAVESRQAWLEAQFQTMGGAAPARLLLKEPLAVPDWASDFTFRATNNGAVAALYLRAVVRDAKGLEFRYHTLSRFSFAGGVFSTHAAERRVREDRFHTPGLGRPVTVPRAGGNILPPRPNVQPQRPLTLVGLEWEAAPQQERDGSVTNLYLTDFAFTGLTPRGCAGYYLFRDQDQYSELEPLPFLTVADFGRFYGRRFDIAWEAFADYAGQPVLAGSASFRMATIGYDQSEQGRLYPLLLAQRLVLPLASEGTWWVRAKLRWYREDKGLPTEIVTRDYRLDVLKGAPASRLPAWPAAADLPGTAMRIAPERNSLVWSPTEPFACAVRFTRPAEGKAPTSALVEARTFGDGTLVRQVQAPLAWDESGHQAVVLDLADQPAGAYRIRAALLAGDQVCDELVRVIGRQSPAAPPAAAIPAGVPSGLDLRDGPRPLFHLTPILDSNVRKDPLTDWEQYWRPFLDKADTLSRDLELHLSWDELEPLPGVYEWRGVDRFLDYAQARGLQTLLQPEIRAQSVPEWLPGCFERDAAGRALGSNAYLFHGARPNYVHAEPVRAGAHRLARTVAERYRGHAGVQGYYFCFENPCDAPWAGWYEGYGPESVAAFRTYARREWGDLAKLNARWQTAFTTWDELTPPARPATADERFWVDWLRFRAEAIDDFLKGFVTSVRAVDKHRLVMVYGEGVRDLAWYRDQGCMIANGGSHDAMHIPGYAAVGLQGLPERTEDHSPGNWTAYFPSQLDASVFAMTTGGGGNTHCKAFVRIRFGLKDAADPDVSLGRFRRFQPIWQALRPTTVPPLDTRLFADETARLVATHSTQAAWATDTWAFLNAMQAHVPVAASKELSQDVRLLIVPDSLRTLADATVDQLTAWVERGGTLMMWADCGRRSLDRPGEDWVLLRRFGFPAPTGECREGRQVQAVPLPGDIFPPGAQPFTLRDDWEMPAVPEATTAAARGGDPNRPLLSWRQLGQGRVLVFWAQTALPPLNAPAGAGYPFLRDIARWAGVRLTCDSDQPLFWVNLLAGRDGKTWFGLVHLAQWQGVPSQGAAGQARWLTLPDGDFGVTELTRGQNLGTFTGKRLREEGLPVRLDPREVAIFQLRSLSSTPQLREEKP